MNRIPPVIAALLVVTSSQVFAEEVVSPVGEIVCPPETSLRKLGLNAVGVLFEGCRDAAGLRQGPVRYTRLSDGSVEGTGTFRNGQEHGLFQAYDAGAGCSTSLNTSLASAVRPGSRKLAQRQ